MGHYYYYCSKPSGRLVISRFHLGSLQLGEDDGGKPQGKRSDGKLQWVIDTAAPASRSRGHECRPPAARLKVAQGETLGNEQTTPIPRCRRPEWSSAERQQQMHLHCAPLRCAHRVPSGCRGCGCW